MEKTIVITTINPPKAEIEKFSKLSGWEVICVGDKKTPANWKKDKVTYLSPSKQAKIFPKMSETIPWSSYARKNIGYLYSIDQGAKIIAETDDDVFPYSNYPKNIIKNKNLTVLSGPKFINIYNFFGNNGAWPRGFPLNFINNKSVVKKKKVRVLALIQNSLIDQDSDFDAIYRLISNQKVKFMKKGEFAIKKGSYCPFNTQNTFFHLEVFPLLYIPCLVNLRVADIWRGYVAQRILWEMGGNLTFMHTTTYTKDRNGHDYINDFKGELPLFLQTNQLIDILDSLSLNKNPSTSLLKVYKKLVTAGIFVKEEIKILETWLKTLEKLH